MSWSTIQERRRAGIEKPLATISVAVRGRRNAAMRTVTMISLKASLVRSLGWASDVRIGLQIGRDENAGKMRMVRNAPPAVACGRDLRGGLCFDLGFLPEAGGEDGQKTGVAVSAIDPDTIEITLPDWSAVPPTPPIHGRARPATADTDDEDGDEGPGESAPAARPPPRQLDVKGAPIYDPRADKAPARPQVRRPATAKAGDGRQAVTQHGVTVKIVPDDETISFGGRETDLTTHQAALALVLLRAAPNFVGHVFARDRVLGAGAPRVDERFAVLVTDLQRAVASVGLTLVSEKGHGLRLKGTDADG